MAAIATSKRRIKESAGDRIFLGFIYVILTLLVIIVLYPLINIISSSISSPAAAMMRVAASSSSAGGIRPAHPCVRTCPLCRARRFWWRIGSLDRRND